MKIVAIIAVRNEEAYVGNLLRHLKQDDIFYAILDNDSTDSTVAIAKKYEFRSHLISIDKIPFDGTFNLTLQLRQKMALIESIDAEWVIHLDADEILQSNRHREHLSDAIRRVDDGGYNAIDFSEFVFLPVDFEYQSDLPSEQPMRHYYFFAPRSPHRMIAWKRNSGLSMVETGGHVLRGANLKLYPEKFAMRHYIFRSQQHAFRKFAERRFAPAELARGWHGNRVDQPVENFCFPPSDYLCCLPEGEGITVFDRSRPTAKHYWQWTTVHIS